MSFKEWKEIMGNPRYGLAHIEDDNIPWTRVCARFEGRKFLKFARFLNNNKLNIEKEILKDFIDNVNDRSKNQYHFQGTLLEIRRAIDIEKYEKIKVYEEFGRCFCKDGACKYVDPRGLTPSEAIELLDILIELGADINIKFRKFGVDEVDKSKFDNYFKLKIKK